MPTGPYRPDPDIDSFRHDVASTEPGAVADSRHDPPGDTFKPVEAETAPKSAEAPSGAPLDGHSADSDPQVALLPPPTQIVAGPAPEGAAGAVIPGALRPVSRPVEEMLIIEMRMRSYVLGEAIEAYQTNGGLLLPLGDYARALDFAITVDPEAGRADGWFLRENRLFSLDLARGEVIVDGESRTIEPGMVELHEADIFVDTRLLSRWFPVDIKFNLSHLNAMIASREPLPIERRLERERLRTRLMGRASASPADYPEQESPYAVASWPFLDATLEAGFFQNADGESRSDARYATLFTGDLLYMNSRFFLSGNDADPLSLARLELGRRDPEYNLLGPLQASEFAMGDVANPPDGLVANSIYGRGARISNFPLDRAAEFDRITLRGELLPGWEAELYRNSALLDIQSSRPDGRYEFTDVPLVFGLNLLRVTLHGPQGQKREHIRRIMVGPGMVRPGEFNYHLSASQHNTSLLPVEDDAALAGTPDPRDGEGRMISQFEVGLSRNLSLAAGAITLPLADGQRSYGTFGLRAIAGDTFGRLDGVTDSEGGRGGTLALQRRLTDNLSVSLEHGIFENFVSEQITANGGMLDSRSRLRLNGVVTPSGLPRVAFGTTARHDRRDTGRQETNLSHRMSGSIGRVSVSSNHLGQVIRGPGEDITTVTGDFLVGGRVEDVYLRGQLGYGLYPERQFETAAVSGTWRIDRNFTGRAGLNHRLETDHTRLTAGLSRRLGVASLGVTAEVASDGAYGGRVTLSIGIGHEPRSGSYMARSRAMAEKGAISARAFLDRNNNGQFDDGDEPLKGVRFRSNNGPASDGTDENGVTFLTGLAPNRRTNIVVAQASIEDPFWIPSNPGVSLVPRPGVAGVVDFPVVATAEIDGTVYERAGDGRHAVSNVRVQLLDDQGRVVKEVRSAYDGFYLFERVVPGRYRVRIDPQQMARLNLAGPPERRIALAPEQVVNGEDLSIGPATALAQGPENPDPRAPAPAPGATPEDAPPESATADSRRAPAPRAGPPRVAETATPIPPAETDVGPAPAQSAEAGSPTGRHVPSAAGATVCRVLRFVVRPGDSLWRIARRIYGSGREYPVLYNANGDKIGDPNLIYPGQRLAVPWRPGMNAELVARLGLREAAENTDLAQAPECRRTLRVVVQRGDSLWRIARRVYGRGTRNMELFQANRDRITVPDLIYPGQVIHLPDHSGDVRPAPVVPAAPRRTAPRDTAAPSPAPGTRRVVVQPGDSLWRIARRAYGQGSLGMRLFRHNHHLVPAPDRIYPGQVIVLPSPETLSRLGAGASAGPADTP